jgi:hypothetical protein
MNDLYESIVAYETAANYVGTQSMNTQSAYVSLAKAIGGWGGLEEARARFRLESAAFVNASNALTAAAARIDLALTVQPETVWPRVEAVAGGSPAWLRVALGTGDRVRTLAELEPQLRDMARGTTGSGDDDA